ncbi:DUF3828 domain-containing protein [Dyella tabacisoli]|uniref:DUF3828 domain-containing protein n=1 Tax=Dyella tabacisoli TaxID=2282381 RepID=A0A369UML5_9GAMM|nr:DUF3828 domain-containing protein [Dyella tabacisoli]RDD80830.1 DUF3828 domain-containing protein [Dyella tabacisoli]
MKQQRLEIFGAWLFVASMMFCHGATAQDVEKTDASAENFLRRVYATYKTGSEPPELSSIATPALRDLLHQEQVALDGEMGVLDADPLCNCQDFDIKVQSIHFDHVSDAHASAVVTFTNFGKASKPVELELAKVKGVWRIDDVAGLQGELKKELKSLKKH